jgi:hypothetical protein
MIEAKTCDHKSLRCQRIRVARVVREISGQTTAADLRQRDPLVAVANRSRSQAHE